MLSRLSEKKLKLFKLAIITATFFAVLLFIIPVLEVSALETGFTQIEGETALPTTDIRIVIVRIINIALGFLGVIVLLIILYGGFVWMTSGGDEGKIETAKSIIKNGVIGLIIIIISFALTRFILTRLEQAAQGPGGGGRGRGGPPIERLSGALGSGPIQMHFPKRSATDIPRNTNIMVTFKDPIDTASVSADNLKVSKSTERNGPFVGGVFRFSSDSRTAVFDPTELIGSPTDNLFYTVSLAGGDAGIKNAAGENVFSGSFDEGYLWEFQTGTFVDATAPQVNSVVPFSGRHPRNILLQITFSEAMDPTSVTGETNLGGSGFRNILAQASGSPIEGSWSIGNEYRTVEFQTNELCGTNSCGGDVFCLPGNSLIETNVSAATLGGDPPASAGFPYDGAVDAVGNSLDGDSDGRAEGPASDSYSWDFDTNNTVDLRPPSLERLSPGIEEGNIALDRPVELTFSKIMSAGTLNNENLTFTSSPVYEFWYSIRSELLNASGEVATSSAPVQTRAVIEHGVLAASTEGARYDYFPGVLSGAKDILQNCFFPGAGPRSGTDVTGGVCATSRDEPYCCNGVSQAARCSYLPNP